MVKRRTGDRAAGLLAAGLFAACFRVGGAWYDIARIDMLFLLLLLAAAALVQADRGWPHHLLAGLLLTLSFLTKQIALPAALPLLLFAPIFHRGRGLLFSLTALALSGLSLLALDHLHDGWYRYYLFDLPRQHEIDYQAMLGFWTTDMLSAVPVALLGAVAFLVLTL